MEKWSLDSFQEETHRTETVVAADHRAIGVAHPAVVEIALAAGKRLHKRLHALPRAFTHPFGALAIAAHPLLTFGHIACVLDGVLVFCLQVPVVGLADGGYFHVVHNSVPFGFQLQRYELSLS